MRVQRDGSLLKYLKKVTDCALEQCFAEPPWNFACLRFMTRRLRPMQVLQRQLNFCTVSKSMRILFHLCNEHSERGSSRLWYMGPLARGILHTPLGIATQIMRAYVLFGRLGGKGMIDSRIQEHCIALLARRVRLRLRPRRSGAAKLTY
jgi:hypothetical protein